jgi:LmbE family N-acetylglucosaminyl deacetylase
MPFEALQHARVALIAPHPDDEIIGAGWLLTSLRSPILIHVTDGSPRDLSDAWAAGFESRRDYAAARRIELYDALRAGGIRVGSGGCETFALSVVDQEASFEMASLSHKLANLLNELRPQAILTCAYEGGHPDHDATSFAVHAACSMMPQAPPTFEFTLYHVGRETGSESEARMETGCFLPGQRQGRVLELSGRAQAVKTSMLRRFRTQIHMLANFPVEHERFRPAPAYDFSEPPHPGKLYYEYFNWGIKGRRWRELAEEAAHELGVTVLI